MQSAIGIFENILTGFKPEEDTEAEDVDSDLLAIEAKEFYPLYEYYMDVSESDDGTEFSEKMSKYRNMHEINKSHTVKTYKNKLFTDGRREKKALDNLEFSLPAIGNVSEVSNSNHNTSLRSSSEKNLLKRVLRKRLSSSTDLSSIGSTHSNFSLHETSFPSNNGDKDLEKMPLNRKRKSSRNNLPSMSGTYRIKIPKVFYKNSYPSTSGERPLRKRLEKRNSDDIGISRRGAMQKQSSTSTLKTNFDSAMLKIRTGEANGDRNDCAGKESTRKLPFVNFVNGFRKRFRQSKRAKNSANKDAGAARCRIIKATNNQTRYVNERSKGAGEKTKSVSRETDTACEGDTIANRVIEFDSEMLETDSEKTETGSEGTKTASDYEEIEIFSETTETDSERTATASEYEEIEVFSEATETDSERTASASENAENSIEMLETNSVVAESDSEAAESKMYMIPLEEYFNLE